MTSEARKAKIEIQLRNQREAGIDKKVRDHNVVNESFVKAAMKHASIPYAGAIDQNDQDQLFDFYGLHFLPCRNKGENMWEVINYILPKN